MENHAESSNEKVQNQVEENTARDALLSESVSQTGRAVAESADTAARAARDGIAAGVAAGLPGLEIGTHGVNSSNDRNKIGRADQNIAHELGKLLTDKHLDCFPGGLLQELLKTKDGVSKLSTGDYLVKYEGKETLFTPNGDSVAVNPDGTYNIKGEVSRVSTDKRGVTTVEFADGARVSLDDRGIRSVDRNGVSVSFMRFKPVPLNEIVEKPYPEPYPWKPLGPRQPAPKEPWDRLEKQKIIFD